MEEAFARDASHESIVGVRITYKLSGLQTQWIISKHVCDNLGVTGICYHDIPRDIF